MKSKLSGSSNVRITVLILAFLHFTNLLGKSHPYSISWIQADLQDEEVVMKIKISCEDLLYFHSIKSDAQQSVDVVQLLAAANNHVAVITSAFRLSDQDGPLGASLASSDFSSLKSATKINVQDLLKFSLHYTLKIPLKSTSNLLTFSQHLTGVHAVSFLSILRNGNELVGKVEIAGSRKFTISRDALSVGLPESRNFMVSYFTLSDLRISHELILPAALLRTFLPLDSTIDVNEIQKFINESSSVMVNGIEILPSISTITLLDDSEILNDLSLINIQIVYPLTNVPKNVSLSWENFNWRMRWFESIIDAFGEETQHKFSRFRPTVELQRDSLEMKKN